VSVVDYEVRGSAAWVTFNRPEAHNAMTFEIYDQLVAHCETVDQDDEIKTMVLRGAGGKAFVAGTDIRQFEDFRTAQDGLSYERTMDRVLDRLEAVRKPTIALVDGFAMGSGLAISATCDLRVVTPDAKFGMPIARTVGNCLSMANYARLAALIGEARVKHAILTAADIDGLATEVVDDAEARVEELCTLLASHSAVTMRVTKEALRRLGPLPDGDDLVREAYGSEEFRARVRAFLQR
jgi:enoyl-CoA hydratase/carnithine racemase